MATLFFNGATTINQLFRNGGSSAYDTALQTLSFYSYQTENLSFFKDCLTLKTMEALIWACKLEVVKIVVFRGFRPIGGGGTVI